ncbi:MAG: hypothetical protein NTW87_16875 [Planctomycetota bacterium]|nr:hypothetical protein [Planctomycetota bacterium]
MATRVISPKMPVATKITLFGGEIVAGEVFVSAVSNHHPGPETLLELLNDNTRAFVPFQTEEGMMLLHRATVRTVDFESPELLAIFTSADNDRIYPLTVILRTETPEAEIEGYCYTGDLRPEAQRPVDLLNTPDMFLLMYSSERMILVNKNAISHAFV